MFPGKVKRMHRILNNLKLLSETLFSWLWFLLFVLNLSTFQNEQNDLTQWRNMAQVFTRFMLEANGFVTTAGISFTDVLIYTNIFKIVLKKTLYQSLGLRFICF